MSYNTIIKNYINIDIFYIIAISIKHKRERIKCNKNSFLSYYKCYKNYNILL